MSYISDMYEYDRETPPGEHTRKARPYIAYWHRESSTSPCRVWYVDAETGDLIREDVWLHADPQPRNLRSFVRGDACYVPTRLQCKHWPTYAEWKTRQYENVRLAWERALSGYYDAVFREAAGELGATPMINLGRNHGKTLLLEAELEAADEIEEALTTRIKELRDENKRILKERDEARAESDSIRGRFTWERDRARTLLTELARQVILLNEAYHASDEFGLKIARVAREAGVVLAEVSR